MDKLVNSGAGSISITEFNKGRAGRIFRELAQTGAKVVTKNGRPQCVILSVEEYNRMADRLDLPGGSSGVLSFYEIRETARRIGAKYGISRIYLFGSYASGSATPESDVDLRFDRGRARGLQIGGIYSDFSEAFGKEIDLIPTETLDRPFLDSIKEEEILLYENA